MKKVKKDRYVIISYSSLSNNKDKHIFYAYSKRQVVGLMITIMDNFNPTHVDILKEEL